MASVLGMLPRCDFGVSDFILRVRLGITVTLLADRQDFPSNDGWVR